MNHNCGENTMILAELSATRKISFDWSPGGIVVPNGVRGNSSCLVALCLSTNSREQSKVLGERTRKLVNSSQTEIKIRPSRNGPS